MQVVERDFTPKGRMKPASKELQAQLKGYLPFYSVDTKEEADAILERAIEVGEIVRRDDGALVEVTLAYEQTLENLELAGQRLWAIHQDLKTEGRL